jgi:hypothetical protein
LEGSTTIPALTELLQQELRNLEQQIASDEQLLRSHREQAAFVRGKLALLAQLVVSEPIISGNAPLEQSE